MSVPDLSVEYPAAYAAFQLVGWRDEARVRNLFQEWMSANNSAFGKPPVEVAREEGEERVVALLTALAEGAYL